MSRDRASGQRELRALLALVAVALVASVPAARSSTGEFETTRAYDAVTGVAIEHPPAWRMQPFDGCIRHGPGVFVSNVPNRQLRHWESEEVCSSEIVLTGIPRDFVLIEIGLVSFPLGQPEAPSPPVSLDDLEQGREPGCSGCSLHWGIVKRRGDGYYAIRVLSGSAASLEDRRAAYRALESLELHDAAA